MADTIIGAPDEIINVPDEFFNPVSKYYSNAINLSPAERKDLSIQTLAGVAPVTNIATHNNITNYPIIPDPVFPQAVALYIYFLVNHIWALLNDSEGKPELSGLPEIVQKWYPRALDIVTKAENAGRLGL